MKGALAKNFGIRAFGKTRGTLYDTLLQVHYRTPHVRAIVSIRVMCQAGRCRAAGARCGGIVAWLCKRAPLWVVVQVCALLRE
jgi:hypothetical protein